jgi:hypothetical protein
VVEGIKNDCHKQQPANAFSSIRTTWESTGNGELLSFQQREKQYTPML